MVDETYDTKLFTPIAQVGSKQVRTTIPAEYTEELREGMKAVTANLLLHKDGCTILTKTGTAAVDHSGYGDFASICSVVQNDSTGEAEVLLLVVQNPGDFGYKYASNLKGAMQELLDLLM